MEAPADVYTVRQVAQLLVVSECTVRRWIKRGRLPVARFGRTVRIPVAGLTARLTPKDAGAAGGSAPDA